MSKNLILIYCYRLGVVLIMLEKKGCNSMFKNKVTALTLFYIHVLCYCKVF